MVGRGERVAEELVRSQSARQEPDAIAPVRIDRAVCGVVATTDFHSSLERAVAMASYLREARQSSVVVDCGDFFEGNWYFLEGAGSVESTLIAELYDVVVPGNHGWARYLTPILHRKTVCANVRDHHGKALFASFARAEIGGRVVGLVGVIGRAAFSAIPVEERRCLTWSEPAEEIRQLQRDHPYVDHWCVLSHSGVTDDRDLLTRLHCDIVFSGHCHSTFSGPVRHSGSWIVKAPELGAGYARASWTHLGTWALEVGEFPACTPRGVDEELTRRVDELRRAGERVLSPAVAEAPISNGVVDRGELSRRIAARVAEDLAVSVLLNETALRATPYRAVVTAKLLADIEPFGNVLVRIVARQLKRAHSRMVEDGVGPILVQKRGREIVTTRYLAQTYFGVSNGEKVAPLQHYLLEELEGGS